MRLLYIVLIVALSGCAAEVGKDKSGDLANENTSLKVSNTDLKLKLDSASRDLETCKQYYKRGTP